MNNDLKRRNQAGAIIHDNINNHQLLEIPNVISEKEGAIYEILSVGFHEREHLASVDVDGYTTKIIKTPIATIKYKDDSVEAYQLPMDYTEWVNMLFDVVKSGGEPFPNEVKFGIVDGKVFANFNWKHL